MQTIKIEQKNWKHNFILYLIDYNANEFFDYSDHFETRKISNLKKWVLKTRNRHFYSMVASMGEQQEYGSVFPYMF